MSSATPHLSLDLLAAEQAQKHITLNEALLKLDALVHLAVQSRTLNAPPAAPEEGERYVVPQSPTGVWAGKAGMVALYSGQDWAFIAPRTGFSALVEDEDGTIVFRGGQWRNLGEMLGELNNVKRLGVGTAADAGNPFAAKLNNALWTASTLGEGGTGDMRFVMNKQAAAHTLSMLLQSNYTGHAEMGLVGNNSFSLKTSANGVAWQTALSADSSTGVVSFPQGVNAVFTQANMPNYVGSSPAFPATDIFDVSVASGTYFVNTNPANLPVSGMSGFVEIMRSGINLAQVTFWSRDNERQVWSVSQGGGNWGAWKRMSWGNNSGITVTSSDATAAASYSRVFKSAVDALAIENVHSANSFIMMNPLTTSGTNQCTVGIGRTTNTTQALGVQTTGYVGNNSTFNDWSLRTGATAVSFFCSNGGNLGIGTTAAPDKLNVAGNITPATDNAHSLGVAARRFSVVYAATGTINTSDGRVKTAVQDSDLGLEFVKALRPCSFRRLDGATLVEHVDVVVGEEPEVVREWDENVGEDEEGNPIIEKRQETRMVPTWGREERSCGEREGVRRHYGFIAQQVKQTADAFGVPDFAGHTLADKNDPDSLQGLRPDQLLAPMVKAIQELSAKVDAQALEIAALRASS